ncbi:MAG: hypothetical protein U0Y68_17735 [Blastocatellia bacterium]
MKITNPALYEAVLKVALAKVEGMSGRDVPDRWLMPGVVTLYRFVQPRHVPILACDLATKRSLVSQSAVQECLRVRDQATDDHRFTGKNAKGKPGPTGGVYFSLNPGALLAEMMFYGEQSVAKALTKMDIPNILPYDVASQRISIDYLLAHQSILVAQLERPVMVADVSLYSQSRTGEVRRFLNEIGRDPAVSKLLVGKSLPDLMLDPHDYSVARAIGHAIQSTRRYDGMLAETARVTNRRGETGSNLILFEQDEAVLTGLAIEDALYFFAPGVTNHDKVMKAAVTTRF